MFAPIMYTYTRLMHRSLQITCFSFSETAGSLACLNSAFFLVKNNLKSFKANPSLLEIGAVESYLNW